MKITIRHENDEVQVSIEVGYETRILHLTTNDALAFAARLLDAAQNPDAPEETVLEKGSKK